VLTDHKPIQNHNKTRSTPLRLGRETAAEVIRERIFHVGNYDARYLTNSEDIESSRRFASTELLRRGSVSPTDLHNGLPIHDSYHNDGLSKYFGSFSTRSGEQLAAGTLFWSPAATVDNLRTPPGQLDPAVAEYMRSLPPGSIAEIGSIVKAGQAVSRLAMISLYREQFRFAEEQNIQLFVAGLHPAIWPAYKRMFGDGVRMMHAADTFVLPPGAGSQKIGIMLDVQHSAQIYRDSVRGKVSNNWPEDVFGKNVDGIDPLADSRRGLVDTAAGLLLFEYFRNRVQSFKNTPRF